MRDDDELKIAAIATATSSADAQVEVAPSFLGTIEIEAVRLTYTQERFDEVIEHARTARSDRILAEEHHKRAAALLEAAREHENGLMLTLKELVRSHVGYEPFE